MGGRVREAEVHKYDKEGARGDQKESRGENEHDRAEGNPSRLSSTRVCAKFVFFSSLSHFLTA